MENNKLSTKFIFTNILLVGFSFLIIYFMKKETFLLPVDYIKLFILFFITWAVSSSYNKKFKKNSYISINNVFSIIIRSNLYHLFILVFILVLFNLFDFSRVHIMGAFLLLFLFELVLYLFYYNSSYNNQNNMENDNQENTIGTSNLLMAGDFVIFLVSMSLGYYLIEKQWLFQFAYFKEGLIFSSLWYIFGMATSKFEKAKNINTNIWYLFDQIIKSVLFILLSISLLIFFLRLDIPLKLAITILSIYLCFELIFYLLIYKIGYFKEKLGIKRQSKTSNGLEKLKITDTNLKNSSSKSNIRGYKKILKFDKNFHNLLINIPNIKHLFIKQKDNKNHSQLSNIPDSSLDVYINTGRFNDIQYINKYLTTVHEKLKPGGYFLGQVDTIRADIQKFNERYPRFLRFLFYPFHFFIFRTLPVLPVTRNIYSFLTQGKRQIISKAETLGRLYYSGYKVLKLEKTKDGFLFLCQNVKTPSRDPDPSFGPLIKLNRIGLDGNLIKIYKFRTMHPYSEYIQDYIYESRGIQNNGKFNNDFRLTKWGKLFRRLWIDELPQLINWIKGDVTLVGVRALSEHYFSLYPEDLKKLRIQFKPGIIPPYYADMPKSFEEIVESERKYLEKKQKTRFFTDIIYFFRVFNNIIFHNARSQ